MNRAPSDLLQAAFADPVLDAQKSFRAALKSLAEPGTRQPLVSVAAIDHLQAASYALCLSLLDNDTPLWLAPAFDTPAIRANLAFHCGCPIVEAREEAMFALLDAAALDDLSGFYNGSERYPDQSCTLLIQLDRLDRGPALSWQGPGIDGSRLVGLPLKPAFWQQRAARNDFPRGLDALFCADGEVLGLPRSTRIGDSLQEVA
ncbi:phosphonate C-P lyase system protein PhnH [Stutzerimonas sp. R40042]|jgi:alpha-D-ribose 1-methylphosphonate 5-triphosphate synthase subunit PhnH|uniref:Carbon-phosphorus lyase complex subunit n=2 Tax=Stutzerimonas stutzeri group TaxID=136846 RepID=M2VF00_STUST|nr:MULTISPECIES: phosphonate C-P lyase system protein PhnH [Stutzerimonas]MBS66977.1 phosphonate C-P lyase system protein PhnH [Pseudomonas sp.]WOF77248.1 phosphonate C-P lyase system protein PhnH [Pseudomonas sp. FeN3W]EMD98248.1 carbon-phosphorus lyase complex subunit [Stutzerimonas stutzeri NF13]MBK3879340.1 phosphonate C-P lyase system protein PhnH [Stutzerimonas stutzeri]MCQ4292166.1 phosphonate C-P lyase system protein PhnH [Stutzerimonas stutzeri]